jgi:hypothetical protein
MSVPLLTKNIFAAFGTDTPVCPDTLTVTAPLEVLLNTRKSFLFAGTIRFVLAPPVPVSSRYIFLATPEAPFGMVIVVSVPVETACVTYPEMACSSSVPRLLLVVVPQVPDCSPIPISSMPKFVL